MKVKLLGIIFFAGAMLFSSCSKEEYYGPVDATGNPVYQTRGGEDGDENTSEGGSDGITDSGHDSDYDSSNKKRKVQ